MGRRSAEFGIIPQGGKPRSLGVVASKVPGWKSTPNSLGLLIRPGATLAISLEPSGGSPTGPVIFSAPVDAIWRHPQKVLRRISIARVGR